MFENFDVILTPKFVEKEFPFAFCLGAAGQFEILMIDDESTLSMRAQVPMLIDGVWGGIN